ncbi:MAG: HEAT repeat domain-containing protein [Candidatus Omnitrophota bacterium]|jgi:hypothetical protein
MYNYHADIVWIVDAVLLILVILTSAVICFSAAFKDRLWQNRRLALLEIKRNIYETVLSGKSSSEAVCQPFVSDITPQQFMDIVTNRSIDAAFFNESEQGVIKNCFNEPRKTAEFVKIAQSAKNKWYRIEAMLCLGYSNASSAIEILDKALSSNDEDIVYFSMISLAQIKTVASAKVLLGFLRRRPSIGYKIASILENFPEDITDEVFKLTGDKDPKVRLSAVTILSRFSPGEDIGKLEALTKDASAEVRAAACDCLGNTLGPKTKETLVKCIKDESWLVKRRAIYALEKVIGRDAVPYVIDLINDASWSVVDAVKDVMTDHIKASLPFIKKFIAGKDYIPKKYSIIALKNSLKSLDPSARAEAEDILSKSDGGS